MARVVEVPVPLPDKAGMSLDNEHMTESPAGQRPIQTGPIAQPAEKAVSSKKGLEPNTVVPTGFSKPVNLLLITGRSDWGLAPRQVIEILKIMKPLGVRVAIAAPAEPPHGSEFRLNASNFIGIQRDEFSFTDFFRLSRAVKNLEINIIHSHGRIGGLYSRLLSLKTGLPVLHTFHGLARREGLIGKIYAFAERVLARVPFMAVFPSTAEHENAVRAGVVLSNRPPLIIEKAVDVKTFQRKKKPAFSGPRLRIGGVARAGTANGPDLLLKLANETSDLADWSSSGLSKIELEKYGTVPEKYEVSTAPGELANWLQSLDVFVCTSRPEGHANGVHEALAVGIPCVLSQIPVHQEIAGGQAAILFEPEDVDGFKDILRNLREDVALRNSVVSNGLYFLERFHNWEKYRENVLEMYRSGLRGW